MRPGPALLVVVLAALFQTFAGPLYRVGNVAPDFPLLALLYLAFFAPPRSILTLGAATAVAVDLVSLDPLGTRLLGYLPALWLTGRVRRGFITESPVLRLGLTFAVASVAFLSEGAFLLWREGRWLGAGTELKAAFYTALMGLAAHAALDRYRGGLGWVRDRYFAS